MATPGDVIENPVTGERITFLVTARDTKGASMRCHLVIQPGGGSADPQFCPAQGKLVSVVEGTLQLTFDGKVQSLGPGHEQFIPKGALHQLKNASSDPVHLQVEMRPSQRAETLLETLFGLARDGKTDAQGRPSFLQASAIFTGYREETAPIRWVDRYVGQHPLVRWWAKRKGFQPVYAQYSPGIPVGQWSWRDCPFTLGRKYRVTHDASALRDRFTAGEILRFDCDTHSAYHGYTGYCFTDEAGRDRVFDVADDENGVEWQELFEAVDLQG